MYGVGVALVAVLTGDVPADLPEAPERFVSPLPA